MNFTVTGFENSDSGYRYVFDVSPFFYPDGECGFNIRSSYREYDSIEIIARITDGNGLFALAMLVDGLRNKIKFKNLYLKIPFFPFARQDRFDSEDSNACFGARVACEFVNSLGATQVSIVDPHSDVVPALLKNVRVFSIVDIFNKSQGFRDATPSVMPRHNYLVSPDAGSNKKVAKLAKYLGHGAFIRADKVRDLSTGKILETKVISDVLLEEASVLIVDDICDGGRTFIELAKALKLKGVSEISLYVTHGLFTQGIGPLFGAGISKIYTTDSIDIKEQHDDLYIWKTTHYS